MLSTVVLAVTGIALLAMPHGQEPPAPARTAAPAAHAPTAPTPAASPLSAGKPAAGAAPSMSATSAPAAVESALPPHGEGAVGDGAIQKALEAAWPPDLPARDERELLAAGRDLLRADATGIGRVRWPHVFPAEALAPAFATTRFRIQAAIARRDGAGNRAVVHLVWAGTDRGGTFTDGRISDWRFTRITTSKGASTWTPQPQT
ncbi:hypothetical protein ACFZDK_49935 [Streptomyces sp. NPDC007901]|uniref:hypothetical protein n=1 Tax=Streptomyces sp. NPDC007901 TaxID=3364785 RepID=UPI0036ECA68A